jgi:hypothetical protein
MAVADSLIRKGDLATDHRARYTILLADVDSIRIEARAHFARTNLGLYTPADDGTLGIFDLAGQVLDRAATVIGRRRARTSLARLEALADEIRLHYSTCR